MNLKLRSSSHSNANTSSSSSSRYKNVTDIFPQSQLLTGYLPEHLVAEILCRLRVKVLLRLRCVSKPWCALIDSPHFVKTHLKRSIQCITNAAVIWMDYRSYSVDFDSLDNVTAIRTAEPLKTRLYGAALVGSCNGLHCLFNPEGGVFLWNPATRKCTKLPIAPIDFRRTNGFGVASLCGFGYDVVNDDYKVLSIFRPDDYILAGSDVIVYSLKTNSWRWLQSISSHFQFIGVYGMFVSGALHWITIKTLDSRSFLSILAFDLGIESYREVSMPKVQNSNVDDLSIAIFADCLCILEDHPNIRTNVWAMNDYGVGNSWCKLFSFGQSKVSRSFESARPVRPVTYSKSGKDVLLEVDKEKLMWYNLKKKTVKTVKIGNIEGVFDLEVYAESLVPPGYNFSCPLQKQPQEKKTLHQKQKNESDGPSPQKLNVSATEHLITEILCRLPVKNLLRFRCVSKPWCSLIDSPRFVKAHLKRSIACKTKPGIIIKSFISSTLDYDSLDHATTAIEIDEPLKTLLYATGVVGSCNGLHCLYNLETDIFLWNPAMRKCRKLPTAPADFLRPFEFDQSSLCGFGYDVVNDDYKVLRIVQPDGHDLCGSKATIYSLKTNSWRRLQNISGHFQFRGAWGIYVGGALHWITVTPVGSPTILAFDLGVENCREVPIPRLQNNYVKDMNIVIFAESLCMLEYHPLIRIDVWVMKDYGVGSSWCKLFSVEQPKITTCCMSIRPIFYSRSRKDVLLEVDSKEVMWYNLRRKRAKTVKISNLPEIFDLEIYTESLVSPDYNLSCGGTQLPSQPQEKKKQQQQRNKGGGFLSKGFKLVL